MINVVMTMCCGYLFDEEITTLNTEQKEFEENHKGPPFNDDGGQEDKHIEERSLFEPGLGWGISIAIGIFAFANTILIGSTMAVTYVIYQILVNVLAVLAPGVASIFSNLLIDPFG